MMCIWLYTSVSYRKIRHFDRLFFLRSIDHAAGKNLFLKILSIVFISSFFLSFSPNFLLSTHQLNQKNLLYINNRKSLIPFFNSYFYRFLFFFFSQMKIIFPYPPHHQLSMFIYRLYEYNYDKILSTISQKFFHPHHRAQTNFI